MKPINFVVLSHPIAMIGDQIQNVSRSLSYLGYQVEVTNSLRDGCLNIVPEGFTRFGARYINEYCRAQKQKICLLMTEHLDLVDGWLTVNDVPLGDANEYLPVAYDRIANLLLIYPSIRFLAILGHLPAVGSLKKVFPKIPILTLPYVPLPLEVSTPHENRRFDLCFTGSMTKYREKIIGLLERYFKCAWTFANDASDRAALIKASRLNLQIPQNPTWRHVSPMRVIFALEAGTATLNVTSFKDALFDSVARPIPPEACVAEIAALLEKGADSLYSTSLDAFNSLAEKSIASSKIASALKIWEEIEAGRTDAA